MLTSVCGLYALAAAGERRSNNQYGVFARASAHGIVFATFNPSASAQQQISHELCINKKDLVQA